MIHLRFATLLCVFTSLSSADVLEIAYSGGKKAETITITLDHARNITPDSIRIGNAFVIRPYYDMSPTLGSTNSGELGLQVLTSGRVWRMADSDTDWTVHTSYPIDSGAMRLLDSVPVPSRGGEVDVNIGYPFAEAGYDNLTDTYHVLDSTIRQVVFVRDANFAAKLQIASIRDTTIGPPPYPNPIRQILSINLRYVINDNPNDLVGPVAIRPIVKSQRPSQFGKVIDLDHYNPLGIRIRSSIDAAQPAFPDSRKR